MNVIQARKENLRWLIVYALDFARPVGTSDAVIHSAILKIDEETTLIEVRKGLDYLEGKKLVQVDRKKAPTWLAKLTADGVDFVEYNERDDLNTKGIARPEQWT